VPKLPGSAFTVGPMIWLTAIAAVLGAGGLLAFRRRDIG
jgi:ABC-2 type transport system permease protein